VLDVVIITHLKIERIEKEHWQKQSVNYPVVCTICTIRNQQGLNNNSYGDFSNVNFDLTPHSVFAFSDPEHIRTK
jgi:hypothetical protein